MLARINIVMSLEDRFDYQELITACARENIVPLQLLEYAQKLGILEMSLRMYPELSPMSAYITLATGAPRQDHAAVPAHVNLGMPEISTTCGSCGGGQIR